jgi:hypothetical protein
MRVSNDGGVSGCHIECFASSRLGDQGENSFPRVSNPAGRLYLRNDRHACGTSLIVALLLAANGLDLSIGIF